MPVDAWVIGQFGEMGRLGDWGLGLRGKAGGWGVWCEEGDTCYG